jgi:hypothetical protein
VSQQIARTLEVMGLDHAEARRHLAKSAGLVGRGRAIVAVLDRIALDATLGDRMLAAGHLAGLWGEPIAWDATTGQRRFPALGTMGARRDRGPPGQPTK